MAQCADSAVAKSEVRLEQRFEDRLAGVETSMGSLESTVTSQLKAVAQELKSEIQQSRKGKGGGDRKGKGAETDLSGSSNNNSSNLGDGVNRRPRRTGSRPTLGTRLRLSRGSQVVGCMQQSKMRRRTGWQMSSGTRELMVALTCMMLLVLCMTGLHTLTVLHALLTSPSHTPKDSYCVRICS